MRRKKTLPTRTKLPARSLGARCLISLLATAVFYAGTGGNEMLGQTANQLDTDSTVGLSGDIARIEFDKATGKLVGIVLHKDHIPLLRAAGDKGNPFRLHVGVKPLEDKPIGGSSIDTREFTLRRFRFHRVKNKPALTLSYACKKGGASLEATLDVVTVDRGAFDLTLEVRNTSNVKQAIMADFPYLSGVTLGEQPATDRSIYMKYAGASGAKAWKDMSNRYGGGWTFQFDIVYNKHNTRSLGYMILDKKFGSKYFQREAAGAMKTAHMPAAELKAGQSHAYPTARVMALAGSWKVIAREYGNWFRANFKTPIQPQWYQETNDFHTMALPDWGAHIGSSKFTTSVEHRRTFFDHFKEHVYLSRELTVQELHGWRNWGPDRCVDPCNNRADLGGNRKMRKGFDQIHQIGRHINSYFGASTGLFDLVKPNKPRSYFELVSKDGSHFKAYDFDFHHPRFGFRQATMCPGLDCWRKWITQATRKVVGHGFDGFRLDEQPFDLDCFNPAHHHKNPYNGPYRVSELMRMVREEMNKIDPEIIVMSESGTDYQVPYINSVMIHSHAGFAVTPARVAFPELYWLPHYPLGAFEGALNGWMIQTDGVCTLGEAQNRAPEMPWPNRDRFANLETHGPVTKWRRLRSQFLDALVHGRTSDIDPYCPEDEFWRGTLFQSKDYYLLVGGYPDGTALPGARKIKLDDLPKEITTAHEIDAYNLKKWPTKVQRDGSNVFVTVKSGFSAVLLPKPSCPPKIEASVSQGKISLTLFAPWRKDRDKKDFKASIEIPGFEITGPSPAPSTGPREVSLPTVVEIKKTAAVKEAGQYYFIIRGDKTLPYRGWFKSK